jgi:hypothetical protein
MMHRLSCGATRRRFIRGAVGAAALLAGQPPLVRRFATAAPKQFAMSYPLVPFSTVVDAWDHHWFLWLPHHPIYESVEVASREPDHDGHVAVWVWFTERAGSKRQVHYRNDPRSASFVGGTYRPISYQILGDDGRPRGVQVRFDDIEGMPVNIDVEFDPDQNLTRQGAGLTDQSGHMSDRAFLVFYRDTSAHAREGRAFIGPTNYAFGREEPQGASRFRWSYSHGISIGLILYNSFKATFGPGGYASSPDTAGLYLLSKAWGGGVSLLSDQTGQLREYVDHDASGDFLRVVFDPPLPACGRGGNRQSSSFSISIRAAADLVQGRVDTACGDRAQVLEWYPSRPSWAGKQPFRSEISRPDDRSVLVAVKPAI